MALLSKKMRKRRGQLERGLKGNWSESHKKRARDELAQIMAVRKRRSEDRTLYNPSHTLGGPDLRKSVDALVESEVAPLRRQAAGLEALGGRLGGQVSQVFLDLAQRQAAQLGQLGGLQQQAAQRTDAANKSTADRLGQIQESVDSSLGRVEDERIAPYRQQAVNALAEQRAQAARSGQAFAGMQAGQAEAARNFAAEMAASAQNRGAEIGGDIRRTTQGRVGDVMAEIANVQGPGRTKLLGEMRENERRWLGEQAAFGIDQAKLQADIQSERVARREKRRESRLDQMNKDRQFQLDREKHGLDVAKDRYQRKHKLGPYKPSAGKGGRKGRALTEGQIETKSTLRRALQDVQRKGGGPRVPKSSHGGIVKWLVEKKKMDSIMARAVADKAKYGKLRPKTRQALYENFRIGGF